MEKNFWKKCIDIPLHAAEWSQIDRNAPIINCDLSWYLRVPRCIAGRGNKLRIKSETNKIAPVFAHGVWVRLGSEACNK